MIPRLLVGPLLFVDPIQSRGISFPRLLYLFVRKVTSGRTQLTFSPQALSLSVLSITWSQGYKTQPKGWGLLGILRLTRRFLATDPQDKVFVLIGVVGDPDNIGLETDYRLSTEEVYLSLAIHNLEKLRNLEL